MKKYKRNIESDCIACGLEVEQGQVAYQLNEGTRRHDETPSFKAMYSVGIIHAACLGEITTQVWETLEPVKTMKLAKLILKTPAKIPIEVPVVR